MAPKRSTQTLIQSIRETLEEMRQEGHTLGVALWQEADADAGYLIHVDGRMVPVGEYQHGFSHIDEMEKEQADQETANSARGEAGKIAGNIDALNDDYREQLNETFAYAFGAESDLVEKYVRTHNPTIESLFELWQSAPAPMMIPYQVHASHTFKVTQDVVAPILGENGNGQLSWSSNVIFKAGSDVTGSVNGNSAFVQVPGGQIYMPAEQVINVQDVVRNNTCRRHP